MTSPCWDSNDLFHLQSTYALPDTKIVTPNFPNFLDTYFQYACRGRAFQSKGGVDTSLVGDELMMGGLIQFFSTRWSLV